ncbi:unnamed protein product [Spirodela intermedia]|uniref:Uncharacterized protein n=1 Tax=Spirodela intermedia TaxID=51605 RepID=A0A7I8IDF1_SPIIN|nr:unnamed protein product [Spirodela intermedia]CAA6655651.1 unnamed protein product [Spirodela intermedia]
MSVPICGQNLKYSVIDGQNADIECPTTEVKDEDRTRKRHAQDSYDVLLPGTVTTASLIFFPRKASAVSFIFQVSHRKHN